MALGAYLKAMSSEIQIRSTFIFFLVPSRLLPTFYPQHYPLGNTCASSSLQATNLVLNPSAPLTS